MLTHLSIKNFALIESLNVSFQQGLTTITGETGAGKSLLLGALGLLLGKRADLNAIKDSKIKCVIEGTFDISAYKIKNIFDKEDIDYEEETIIRREILPSGKSRAFINDTPVTLQALSTLGIHLIDIHSQHQTLEVTSNDFQFSVLDALAKATPELGSYQRGLSKLKTKEKALKELETIATEAKKEYEYNTFLLQELIDAKLKANEQETLEESYKQLNNVEEIQNSLSEVLGVLTAEELGANAQLNTIKLRVHKIANYSDNLQELATRMESLYIELDDIQSSLETEFERFEADPEALERTDRRLKLLYDLQNKHSVTTVNELITIQNTLQERVEQTAGIDDSIELLKEEIAQIQQQLDGVAQKLHQKRDKALPQLLKSLTKILHLLGMPNASFNANVTLGDTYLNNGKDVLSFLFSANKGGTYGELKKVASGGELSRIMLAIKTVLSKYKRLPTIIFDEIDTGVSGEVAQKMADLLLEMSTNLQVFSITHLPQIAAKGQTQYKVFKQDINDITVTQLKLLSADDRVTEIAQMLGGTVVTASAITHAKELLELSK